MTEDNSLDASGTPDYMAPEVTLRKPNTIVSDYFAVGVIAFECMKKRRPYNVEQGRKSVIKWLLNKSRSSVSRYQRAGLWSLHIS